MSQGYCPLPGCEGFCCVHLDKRITQLEAECKAHREALSRFLTTVNPAGYDDEIRAEEAFELALTCVIADREVRAELQAANNRVRELEAQNNTLREAADALGGICAELRGKRDEARAERDELQIQLDRALSELAEVRRALKTLFTELGRLSTIAQGPLATVGRLLRKTDTKSVQGGRD